MASKDKYHVKDNAVKGHVKDKNPAGGACLSSHVTYHAKHSCSYRWQSCLNAEDHPKIYVDRHNAPIAIKKVVDTLKDKGNKYFPKWYAYSVNLPEMPGDWVIGGPYRGNFNCYGNVEVPAGKNFEKAQWPYWNNAHHILPRAIINNCIQENENSNPDYAKLLRKGLLEAGYNLNYKINVMILPQDYEVGKVLQLPRHLILNMDTTKDVKNPHGDHEIYSARVKAKVENVFTGFINKCKQEKSKQHKVPKIKLNKKKLEHLSRKFFGEILVKGKYNPGMALDEVF